MKVDFAVVGGGPAGLAVAIEAARAGASCVVVERCHGPVDKACGEGLMHHGVARLGELGVRMAAGGTHPMVGIRYIDGELEAQAEFVEGPGLGVRRLALEEGLQERAIALGVPIWGGVEAVRWTQTGQGVTVQTTGGEVVADWLVAADGLHSRIRTQAGIPVTLGRRRRFGVRCHFAVRPWTPFVEVHWGEGVEAYVTPVGPQRVGVAFLWSGGAGNHPAFVARFPDLAARLGDAETSVRGAGPFQVRAATQFNGRVLLAGDAAGYLDAITGEGVSLALHGARPLVAAALARRPQDWPVAWRALTRRHLLLTRVLLEVGRRPWLRRRMMAAFSREPRGFAAFLALNSGAWSPWRALPGVGRLGLGLLTG